MEPSSCRIEQRQSALYAQDTDSENKDSTPAASGRPLTAGAAPTHQTRSVPAKRIDRRRP